MDKIEVVLPDFWPRPRGYSNAVIMPPGRALYVAGQVGWDIHGNFTGNTFAAQFRKALENVCACVEAAGSSPEYIGRLTIYVTDKGEYLNEIKDVGNAYREVMGKHYPAMALVEVKGLVEPGAKVEIEADAVVPDNPKGQS
jgi:enamine deaminase RidA (YjgF/YER057c/UK114 family)